MLVTHAKKGHCLSNYPIVESNSRLVDFDFFWGGGGGGGGGGGRGDKWPPIPQFQFHCLLISLEKSGKEKNGVAKTNRYYHQGLLSHAIADI